MKSCPRCQRTYADDSLIFCTEDGANLTSAHDPNDTWHIPAARSTDPPVTEVIPPDQVPGYVGATQAAPTIPAPVSPTRPAHLAQPPSYHPPPAATRRNSTSWIIASVAFALVALSLVAVLGYLVLNRSTEGNKNSPPNANNGNLNRPGGNTNGNDNTDPKQSENWLAGEWHGEGAMQDGSGTWSIDVWTEDDHYAVDYPTMKCSGRWDVKSQTPTEAVLYEKFTIGKNCESGARIDVKKRSADQIGVTFTIENSDAEVVSVTLNRVSSKR
ncbi:MAG: hypothetical protein ABIZ95_08515 [Pyrinomonadaceae bacterium]